MDMMDIIKAAGGVSAIAKELGVDEGTALSGATALLPAILGGFKSQAQTQPEGLGGLMNVIGGLGGGGLLASVLGAGPSNVDAGNNVLGQIFGSKDVSRTVADDASTKTGLSSELLKKMLPLLAMAVAGYMASHAGGAAAAPAQTAPTESSGGGLGGMLGNVLGGLLSGGQAAQVPAPGLGGLGSLLDMDHDGNPLNDIIGMAGKFAAR
jgi:hypothetical protein